MILGGSYAHPLSYLLTFNESSLLTHNNESHGLTLKILVLTLKKKGGLF